MTLTMETLTPIARDALEFKQRLVTAKEQLEPPSFWYPYDTLANFVHLGKLDTDDRVTLEKLRGLTIADVGAADGDMAFYLESLGNESTSSTTRRPTSTGCAARRE